MLEDEKRINDAVPEQQPESELLKHINLTMHGDGWLTFDREESPSKRLSEQGNKAFHRAWNLPFFLTPQLDDFSPAFERFKPHPIIARNYDYAIKQMLDMVQLDADNINTTDDERKWVFITFSVSLYLVTHKDEIIKQELFPIGDDAIDAITKDYGDLWKIAEASPNAGTNLVLSLFMQGRYPKGELVFAGNRQVDITDSDFQHALTTLKNNTAYIRPLAENVIKGLKFENGLVTFKDGSFDPTEFKKETEKGTYEDITEFDTSLFRQVFTAVYNSAKTHDTYTVTVSIPEFCKEMGVDIRHKTKSNDIFGKIERFSKCIGVVRNGTLFLRVLEIMAIDKTDKTITFATPYMNYVLREVEKRNSIYKNNQELKYISPAYNMLIHSTIVKERNKAAVEIVSRILAGLFQRGAQPDAQLEQNKKKKNIKPNIVTYRTKFSTLIENIPILNYRLTSATTTRKEVNTPLKHPAASKNAQINRAFTRAYELLHEQTDAYKYFYKLNIPNVIPTTSTLNNVLIITHQGIDGQYEAPR